MENASKALIIAGSVLLSILIISALVLMFNQLGELKRTEASAEDLKKINEYNKQIEGFERAGLYGSEILSIANLVNDYNQRQSDLKGYEPIIFKVEFASENDKLKKEYTQSTDLTNDFNQLENKLIKLENRKYYGKTLDELSKMKSLQLKNLLLENNEPIENLNKEEVMDYLKENNSNFKKEIEEYEELKTSIRNIKNRKFQKPEITYNKQGNIKSITIKQIGV